MCSIGDSEHDAARELMMDVSLFRQDSVTARAISRLSHGVARLNTSTSPTRHYAFRLKPQRDERLRKDQTHSTLSSLAPGDESVSPWSKREPSGSKRKWQSWKPDSNIVMETDVVGCTGRAQLYKRSSVRASQGAAASIDPYLPSDPDVGMDSFDYCERCSSCSSMLSVTTSGVSESDGSHASEADEEDANTFDQSTCVDELSSATSSTSKRVTKCHRFIPTLHPRVPTYGGDSSDGFSSSVKIPRLGNSCALGSFGYLRRTRHSNRHWVRRSFDVGLNSHTQDRGYLLSIDSGKRVKSTRAGHFCRIHSDSRFRVAGALTCRPLHPPQNSPRGAVLRPLADGLEELADDEQSDFPADEIMPIGDHYLDQSGMRPIVLSRAVIERRSSGVNRPARPSTCCLADLESDFEDFFDRGWPSLDVEPSVGKPSKSSMNQSNEAGMSTTECALSSTGKSVTAPSEFGSLQPYAKPDQPTKFTFVPKTALQRTTVSRN